MISFYLIALRLFLEVSLPYRLLPEVGQEVSHQDIENDLRPLKELFLEAQNDPARLQDIFSGLSLEENEACQDQGKYPRKRMLVSKRRKRIRTETLRNLKSDHSITVALFTF